MQPLFSKKDRTSIIELYTERQTANPVPQGIDRMHLLLDCAETVHAQKHQNRVLESQNLADPDFKGDAYEKEIDQKPLTKQMLRIFHVVQDEQWRTLEEISRLTGAPEASVSAALRALTNVEWGRHVKYRERIHNTRLFRYRIVPNRESLTWKKYMEAREAGQLPQ